MIRRQTANKTLIATALACALMALPVTPAPAISAVVYYVATGENVLPLSDETMPFWDDGELYIASSIFTGLAREALGISRVQIQDNAAGAVVLYRGGNSLLFEIGKSYAIDPENNLYSPGALERDGNFFVPASIIARYFDLQYSVTEVKHGYLVWLRHTDFQLSEQVFADAASYHLENLYEDYERSAEPELPVMPESQQTEPSGIKPQTEPQQQPEPQTPSSPQTPAQPHPQSPSPQPQTEPDPLEPPVPPPVPVEEEIGGQDLYLCLRAGSNAPTLLDTLEEYDVRATFLCPLEFLDLQGDLLRRMTVSGQSIALLADGKAREQTVIEQLEEGNRFLQRAACRKTRLALILNGSESDRRAAQAIGYCCLTLSPDRRTLRTSEQAQSMLSALSHSERPALWPDGNLDGLGTFLQAALAIEDRFLALTETAQF